MVVAHFIAEWADGLILAMYRQMLKLKPHIRADPGAGFLLPVLELKALQPPFDISGDLDTPVAAFMKLASFAPRFLLESVEGGERLARYSFIGFGDGLEVRLDRAGFAIRRE